MPFFLHLKLEIVLPFSASNDEKNIQIYESIFFSKFGLTRTILFSVIACFL